MSKLDVHIRRCRRTDFTAIVRLLGEAGEPVPPPDRAALRRFRAIVADLAADVYLALDDDEPIGFVYATYTRQLATRAAARIEQLVVAPSARGKGVGERLLRFIERRAIKRGCPTLSTVVPNTRANEVDEFLQGAALSAAGLAWRKPLPEGTHNG